MNQKRIATIFYLVACLFGALYIIAEMLNSIDLSEIGRLVLLGGSCFFLYFGGLFLSKYRHDNKPMKINLWIFFGLYLVLLITLTLFDPLWNRNGFSEIKWFNGNFGNLIPFKTIISYLKEFDSMYSNRTIILNLLGNFVALMPLAFFLPMLFKKQNKFLIFLSTIGVIDLGIEFLQQLTSSGAFDVDDLILNVLGAVFLYFIFKINDVNKLLKNIFLCQKNKIKKKNLFIIYSSVILVLVSVLFLIKYRDKLYKANYDRYNRLHNPIIKIIDESSNDCDEKLDLFYEDEFYNYYFTCDNSNRIYADIEDDKKYLVKDIVNGKTEYDYDINRMLEILDRYQVFYIKENKYQFIPFDIKIKPNNDGIISSPNHIVNIKDKDILEVVFDNHNAMLTDDSYRIDLHIIPKKIGTTILEVSFKDEGNHSLASYQYSVEVDEKLNVNYIEINAT